MKVRSLIPFNAFGIVVGEAGKVFEVGNDAVTKDLINAKFVEEVGSDKKSQKAKS